MIYASWFIMFGLIAALISLIVTVMWKWPLQNGSVLAFTNPVILLIILTNYYWCALASVGFISSFITERKLLPWLSSYSRSIDLISWKSLEVLPHILDPSPIGNIII